MSPDEGLEVTGAEISHVVLRVAAFLNDRAETLVLFRFHLVSTFQVGILLNIYYSPA